MLGRLRGRKAADVRSVEERIVWLFGSPRAGTGWLLRALAEHERVVTVDEPAIGMHLAPFTADVLGVPSTRLEPGQGLMPRVLAGRDDYLLADRWRDAWSLPLRDGLLARFGAQLAEGGRDALMVVKETTGSQAADTVLRLLPRSRVIVLVRDEAGAHPIRPSPEDAADQRIAFLRERARRWVCRMEVVQRAYRLHDSDRRLMLRAADLRANPAGRLGDLFAWLGLRVGLEQLRGLLERNPPELDRAGRFTPAEWTEGLRPDEHDAIAALAGKELTALGY